MGGVSRQGPPALAERDFLGNGTEGARDSEGGGATGLRHPRWSDRLRRSFSSPVRRRSLLASPGAVV